MRSINFLIIPLFVILLSECGASKQTPIPLSASIELDDTYTLIWNGISKAYR